MPRRVFIFLKKTGNSVSYLPHRQLRNPILNAIIDAASYLPHRQLRNPDFIKNQKWLCYLPHRQLRN